MGPWIRDALDIRPFCIQYSVGQPEIWPDNQLIMQLDLFKRIVSRDFEWLQIILMNRSCVPDVPLKDYSFLNIHFHHAF